jgi:hypothetical protein
MHDAQPEPLTEKEEVARAGGWGFDVTECPAAPPEEHNDHLGSHSSFTSLGSTITAVLLFADCSKLLTC